MYEIDEREDAQRDEHPKAPSADHVSRKMYTVDDSSAADGDREQRWEQPPASRQRDHRKDRPSCSDSAVS